jgi:isopentenyl phosphate kinase
MCSRERSRQQGRVYVIKLGGSVITDKRVPFSLNIKVLRSLAEQISELLARGVSIKGIVIGGGSYGHYVASVYKNYDSPAGEALSTISNVMLELALAVSDILQGSGINVVVFPPHAFCKPSKLRPNCDWRLLFGAISVGVIPLVYGDVYPCEKGWCIVSGDELSIEMACSLSADYVVYVTDVDGLLDSEGNVVTRTSLKELRSRVYEKKSVDSGLYDVTGGIERKIRAIEVNYCEKLKGIWVVNGLRKDVLLRLVSRDGVIGTFIDLSGR